MTMDQSIAIWAAIGNGVAGIGAAIAAGIMAWQTWSQRTLERDRYKWLEEAMIRIRNGTRGIAVSEVPMALYWINQGVLDVYPPTAYPDKFLIRYRTEGQ